MNWFSNLVISKKLMLSYAIILIIICIIGYDGVKSLSTLNDNSSEMYWRVSLPLEEINKITNSFQQVRVLTHELIKEKESNKQQEILRKIEENFLQINNYSNDLKDHYKSAEGQKLFGDFYSKFKSFESNFNEVKRLTFNNQAEEAENYMVNNGTTELADETLKLITDMANFKSMRAKQFSERNSEIYQSSKQFMIFLIILSIGLGIFFGYIISKAISVPINKTLGIINKLAAGELNHRLNINQQDEIGKMSLAIDHFCDKLNKFSNSMLKVSEGDLSFNEELLSNQDQLTPSFNKIINTLRSLIEETNKLTNAATEGNLNERADTSGYKGGYKDLLIGINQMLDSVILPIQDSNRLLSIMSEGDFRIKFEKQYKGQHQLILDNIKNLKNSLSYIINEVVESINATASASSQISASTEEMASGAHEQSAQASEVTGAIAQMTQTILDTTKNANKAAETAKKAGTIAKEGGKVVRGTVDGMKKIAEVVNEASVTVENLGKSSDEIGNIIQVINDIADQTNLLALNAAIEAARAGEQGRGFAVVADEVRKLAERTSKATKEIAEMIKQIQKETADAVVSMKLGTSEVEKGRTLADKAGKSLEDIITGSSEVVDIATQVAAASEEQSSASEIISTNIESINNVSQEFASGIQQVARAAEDLNRLTDNLQSLINQFKIEQSSHQENNKTKKLAFRN